MTLSMPMLLLIAFVLFALGWLAARAGGDQPDSAAPPSPPPPARPFSDLGPALRAEIESAIADGHKIEAVKLLREATGMGLKESKETVEAMEAALESAPAPLRTPAPPLVYGLDRR